MRPSHLPKSEIDVSLSVLCSVSEPGVELSAVEIAEVCGCHPETIKKIEYRAKRKIFNSKRASVIALDYGFKV